MIDLIKYINMAKEENCGISFDYSTVGYPEEFIIRVESKSFAKGVIRRIRISDVETLREPSDFDSIISQMIKEVSEW